MTFKNLSYPLAIIIVVLSMWGCGKGESTLINQKCGACHSYGVVYEKKRTADDWDRLIFAMKSRGLKVTPEEEKEIRDFLSKHYTIGSDKRSSE